MLCLTCTVILQVTGVSYAKDLGIMGQTVLTLQAPITTAADDIHKYFFIVFQRK